MKNILKYVLVGFIFGIVLTKSEDVSWYRIYEMFQFQSFHLYGIIGIQIIKRNNIKDIKGESIEIPDKEKDLLDTGLADCFLDWVGLWLVLAQVRYLSYWVLVFEPF